MKFVPNTHPNLVAVIITEGEYYLSPILYWFEARYKRHAVPVVMQGMSLASICELDLAVYDIKFKTIFAHNGAIYSSFTAYMESRK